VERCWHGSGHVVDAHCVERTGGAASPRLCNRCCNGTLRTDRGGQFFLTRSGWRINFKAAGRDAGRNGAVFNGQPVSVMGGLTPNGLWRPPRKGVAGEYFRRSHRQCRAVPMVGQNVSPDAPYQWLTDECERISDVAPPGAARAISSRRLFRAASPRPSANTTST